MQVKFLLCTWLWGVDCQSDRIFIEGYMICSIEFELFMGSMIWGNSKGNEKYMKWEKLLHWDQEPTLT